MMSRRPWQGVLLGGLLSLSLLTAAGLTLLPYAVGRLLIHELAARGLAELCFRDIDIDPWHNVVHVVGIDTNRCQATVQTTSKSPLLQLDRLEIQLASPIIMTQPLRVARLTAVDGVVDVADRTLPLADWLNNHLLASLERIEWRDVTLRFGTADINTAVRIDQAQFTNIAQWWRERASLQLAFNGAINGAPTQLSGTLATTLPGTRHEATFELQISTMPLFPWSRLLPLTEVQELEGRLGMTGKWHIRAEPDHWSVQHTGRITLSDLQLQAKNLRIDTPQLSWSGHVDYQPQQLTVQGYLDNKALDIEWLGQGMRLRHGGARFAVNLAMMPDVSRGNGWRLVQQQQRLRIHQLKLRWPKGRFNDKLIAWNGWVKWRLAPEQLWPHDWRSQGRLKIDGLDIEAVPPPPSVATGQAVATNTTSAPPPTPTTLGVASLSSGIDLSASVTEQSPSVTITQKGPTTVLWLHAAYDGHDLVERFLSWQGQWRLLWQPTAARLPRLEGSGRVEGKYATLKLDRSNWVIQHRGLEWHGRASTNPEEGGEFSTAGRCSLNDFSIEAPKKRLSLLDIRQSDWQALYTTGSKRFDIGHLRAHQLRIGSRNGDDNSSTSVSLQQEEATIEELRFTTPNKRLSFKNIQIDNRPGQNSRLHPVWELLASLGISVPGSGIVPKAVPAVAVAVANTNGSKATAQSSPISSPNPSQQPAYAIVTEAFRRHDEAVAALAQQRQNGPGWVRSQTDPRGHSWHSVLIGPYPTQAQAQAQLAVLKKSKKNKGAYITTVLSID
ncbi:MAG: SPOR domain-containing protein [Magnetococcales bacterium]|nr:SPOR domain-containing protein [Magnetococcales bacterium]